MEQWEGEPKHALKLFLQCVNSGPLFVRHLLVDLGVTGSLKGFGQSEEPHIVFAKGKHRYQVSTDRTNINEGRSKVIRRTHVESRP